MSRRRRRFVGKKDGYRQRNVRQFLQSAKGTLFGSRESCRYVLAFRFAAAGIWARQESLRHILACPGYAPGTIAVIVIWMDGFNACQTNRSMYPSIFNRFPVIQPVSSKVRHFNTFLHILASPGYAPESISVNV